MAYLSTVVSGVASLGVLIALICGIFFLVLTSLRWVSRVRDTLYGEELGRQKRHLISENSFTRSDASGIIYATKETQSGKSVPPDFEGIQFIRIEDAENNENDLDDTKKNLKLDEILGDTVHVREFIEKIVETIIGDPLDGTTVGKLSTHSAYLTMFMKYHGRLCRELAKLIFSLQQLNFNERIVEPNFKNSVQKRLKRLLKRIIYEAMSLPNIKDLLKPKENGTVPSENFINKSYEDILATAILNKVVEKFQNKTDTVDEDQRQRVKHRKLKRVEENEDDSDWSQSSRSDKLSLTIEEYIEEVTTSYEVSDDEYTNYDSKGRIPFPESGRILRDGGTDEEISDLENESSVTELRTSTGSWEENWLFQKKRLRSTPNAHHPVPVPMLVPNPSEDFRALVGGVDADELSDISDCTDFMSEDTNSNLEEINQISQGKFRVFKSVFENKLNENELHKEEGLQNLELEIKPKVPEKMESENRKTKEAEIERQNMENEMGNMLEVAEKCVSAESAEIKKSCSNEIPSQQDREVSVEQFDFVRHEGGNSSPSSGSDNDFSSEESKIPFIRCRIAEREKEKWKNAVDLPENPYSKENIEKRAEVNSKEYFRLSTYIRNPVNFPEDLTTNLLSESSESQRFSRDYYINASKHPSGTSSPSSPIQTAEKSEQVSRHLREDFLFEEGKVSKNLSKSIPNLNFAKYFAADERFKNTYFSFKNQTTKNQHYSNVFKTSECKKENFLRTNTPKKYISGFHSLKLRPKRYSTNYSLDEELSNFEQKSLREDVNHTVLRARGASPNFTLNPVFTPEVASEKEFDGVKLSSEETTRNDSDNESEFNYSEPVNHYCRKFVKKGGRKGGKKSWKMSQESGYGSDSLDYSSDSLECWRLTPPKAPEVIQSDVVSFSGRRSKESFPKPKSSFSGF